jgi:fatty-acyl-CoA synthase
MTNLAWPGQWQRQWRSFARGAGRRLAELPGRARTGARVARQSGLLFGMSPRGVQAAMLGLLREGHNPSLIFKIHAANTPDKPALLWRDHRLTFAELDERMNRAAAGLQRRGFVRNTSVIIMMRNRPEFVEVQSGAARIGAAGVSVSWRSTAPELAFLANHCSARAIVFEADLWPVIEQAKGAIPGMTQRDYIVVGGDAPGCDRYEEDFLAPRSVVPRTEKGDEQEGAVVIYTSGTTGKPKGAVRKFPEEAMWAVLRFIAETPMRVDDVHLVACPLYHTSGFGFLAMNGILGATSVLMDEFRPEAFLELVERHGVTTTALVPTMLHRVLGLAPEKLAAHDTRTLDAIFSVAAPLPGPLAVEAMDRFGDVIFNCYGSTETGLVTIAKPADLRAAPGTIGRLVPGNEIRLLGEDGREVEKGQVGELYARNDMLVAGYHEDPEATAASQKDGFFSVGDLARRDRDGRYFIEGRKRDMIISGGVNVYPAEVEAALEAHPEVSEVAVVGFDDPDWGERVRAFVVRRAGSQVDDAALRTWCRERLSGAKVPRDYVFLDVLPRNPTGKVLKRELRALPAPSPSPG